jgi:hypothetical protein
MLIKLDNTHLNSLYYNNFLLSIQLGNFTANKAPIMKILLNTVCQIFIWKVKVMQFLHRPGLALRVPGG